MNYMALALEESQHKGSSLWMTPYPSEHPAAYIHTIVWATHSFAGMYLAHVSAAGQS